MGAAIEKSEISKGVIIITKVGEIIAYLIKKLEIKLIHLK